MKKSDIKQYYVEDYIYVDHEPCSVSKEMWTAQEIIECLINRTHMGYDTDFKIYTNHCVRLVDKVEQHIFDHDVIIINSFLN